MSIGRKIKRAITGPMNKIKEGILKPIKVVLELIMKIIKMFKSFVQSIFLYIKCVIKLMVNFHKCVWYYILDAFKYLILTVVLFFVVTIAGLCGYNTSKAARGVHRIFGRAKYSNGIMNDCYRCKPKGDAKTPGIFDMLKKMLAEQFSPASKDEPFSFFTLFLFCIIGYFIGLFIVRFFYDRNTRVNVFTSSITTITGIILLFLFIMIAVFIYEASSGKDADMDGDTKDDEGDSKKKRRKNTGFSFMYVMIIFLTLMSILFGLYVLMKKITS